MSNELCHILKNLLLRSTNFYIHAGNFDFIYRIHVSYPSSYNQTITRKLDNLFMPKPRRHEGHEESRRNFVCLLRTSDLWDHNSLTPCWLLNKSGWPIINQWFQYLGWFNKIQRIFTLCSSILCGRILLCIF